MARGRMIKPELWASSKINSVSLEANLLFIAMLNFCDDFGLIPNSDRLIIGNCFPFRDSVSEKNIQKWKDELLKVGLIAKIQHETRNLLCVVKWEKHQTIMNRSKRNHIDNNLEKQEVIDTIETLINNSLDSNYPIDNRQETNDKRKETSEKSKNDTKKKSFGESGLVKLTEKQHSTLIKKYGEKLTEEKLLSFEASKQRKDGLDHYLTINNWCRKDKTKESGVNFDNLLGGDNE